MSFFNVALLYMARNTRKNLRKKSKKQIKRNKKTLRRRTRRVSKRIGGDAEDIDHKSETIKKISTFITSELETKDWQQIEKETKIHVNGFKNKFIDRHYHSANIDEITKMYNGMRKAIREKAGVDYDKYEDKTLPPDIREDKLQFYVSEKSKYPIDYDTYTAVISLERPSIPERSIPVSSIPVSSIPVSSIPVSSIPVSSNNADPITNMHNELG
jgi:hypothetical protein